MRRHKREGYDRWDIQRIANERPALRGDPIVQGYYQTAGDGFRLLSSLWWDLRRHWLWRGKTWHDLIKREERARHARYVAASSRCPKPRLP